LRSLKFENSFYARGNIYATPNSDLKHYKPGICNTYHFLSFGKPVEFSISVLCKKTMNHLPFYLPMGFTLLTILTLYLFYLASNRNRIVLTLSLLWLLLQGVAGLSGFYQVTESFPPRILFLMAPPVLLIIVAMLTSKGQRFINGLNLRWMIWLQVVRIPVELVLLGLYLHQMVPKLMTFEGQNFDILSGLTAPLIAYYGYTRKQLPKGLLLGWNLLCLLLLVNIVVLAILSLPTPFQQLAFDQPNRAISYFPFVWLASFIVPVVLLGHVAALTRRS
jgi:hypothetical protein